MKRHLLTALFIVVGSLLFGGGIALAQDVDPGNTVAALRLSAVAVSMLIGSVIPLVVALVTKWSDRGKGLVQLVLNAVQTVITANVVRGSGFVVLSLPILVQWLLATATSIVAYLNVWRPLELTSSLVDRVDGFGTISKVPGKLSGVGLRRRD